MTPSPGLRGWSRLQAGRGVLQTPTDDDDNRRQRSKQYWPIRRASSNKNVTCQISTNQETNLTRLSPGTQKGYKLICVGLICLFAHFDNNGDNILVTLCYQIHKKVSNISETITNSLRRHNYIWLPFTALFAEYRNKIGERRNIPSLLCL